MCHLISNRTCPTYHILKGIRKIHSHLQYSRGSPCHPPYEDGHLLWTVFVASVQCGKCKKCSLLRTVPQCWHFLPRPKVSLLANLYCVHWRYMASLFSKNFITLVFAFTILTPDGYVHMYSIHHTLGTLGLKFHRTRNDKNDQGAGSTHLIYTRYKVSYYMTCI